MGAGTRLGSQTPKTLRPPQAPLGCWSCRIPERSVHTASPAIRQPLSSRAVQARSQSRQGLKWSQELNKPWDAGLETSPGFWAGSLLFIAAAAEAGTAQGPSREYSEVMNWPCGSGGPLARGGGEGRAAASGTGSPPPAGSARLPALPGAALPASSEARLLITLCWPQAQITLCKYFPPSLLILPPGTAEGTRDPGATGLRAGGPGCSSDKL